MHKEKWICVEGDLEREPASIDKGCQVEWRDRQLLYMVDETVAEEMKKCRKILQQLNFMDRSDSTGIAEVVKELFGSSDGAIVNPPFYCDYGSRIHVGKNFFANYNCTIIDVARVTIGDNCQMAPNVAIYTAGHPIHPATRNTSYPELFTAASKNKSAPERLASTVYACLTKAV